ncbi:MAG: beta-lactamase family protein [Thermoleophilaceae bacterium]|nr:beta-lactamase family protein [Thermoleophilaceae bacterium]
MRLFRWTPLAAIAVLFCLAPASALAGTSKADVFDSMADVLDAKGGPPGAIVTMHRGGKTTTLAAGTRQVGTPVAPKITDHMRIASVAKAFTGAVVLRLVDQEPIALDDTVGKWLPSMPVAWHNVTLRQLLNHTSGVPDYTKSKGFFNQFETAPKAKVTPQTIIDWVRADPLLFPSGTNYEYSNTDNILAALMVEVASNRTYASLLKSIVFNPLKLRGSSLPTSTNLTKPFIHGYVAEESNGGLTDYTDVSTILSPTGAWASGGIESTPKDLGKFIRAYLAKRFFSTRVQKQQLKWFKGGESSPAGPGKNSAGLSIFRYETRCGTVYGHTGNFPGYVQFAAANKTGTRSVTTSLNIPAPTGKLLRQLRELQTKAVCFALGK